MSGHLTQAYRGGFNGRPGWWLHFSFDEELVERLKRTIPSSARTWDELGRRWWVAQEHEETAQALLPGLEAYRAQGALL